METAAGHARLALTFSGELQRPWLTDGTADWLWPAAKRADIPIMPSVPGSLPVVDRIAERYPGLQLVFDHLGISRNAKGDEAFAGLPEPCTLARRPNVAATASAPPCHSTEPYPLPGLHQHIRRDHDAFSPRPAFWGTDWTRLPRPRRQPVMLVTEELPWLPAADQEWIMKQAICDWRGWPVLTSG